MKWEFYSAVDEDFLAYAYDDETNTFFSDTPTRGASHKSLSVTIGFVKRYPSCDICSME